MTEEVKTVTLRGKTLKGKNTIRNYGDRWHIWRRDNVPCFNMELGILISPEGAAWHHVSSRWVRAAEVEEWKIADPNLEVVDETA